METIGERIKKIRKSNGLTIVDFGKRIGVSNPAVSMMENGKSNPSNQTIVAICREFGINEDWLRTGEGEERPQYASVREEEMTELFAQLMNDRPPSVRRRLIASLLRFNPDDPKEWELLERIVNSVVAEAENSKKEESESE